MRQICTTFILCFMFNFLFGQNQDWPNLEKYRTANESVKPLRPGEFRVVFMGNSITEGWPKHRPEFFTNSEYINRGISGQTTPQMLIRFRPDVIELKPSVVVILAGTNDLARNTGYIPLERIMGNIKSMTELARAHGIEVVLCSVLPAIDFPWRSGLEPAEKIIALNAMIKSYAKEMDIHYVDYYGPLVDSEGGLKVPDYTTANDLVHPNAKGYELMEAQLLPVLAELKQ